MNLPNYFLADLPPEAALSPLMISEACQTLKRNREQFLALAYEAKRRGLRFVADSCPGRGAVLVNYYGLDKELLPYIAQLPGSEKIGKYLPGTRIPIVDNEIILKEQPDYIVILAWHYAEYIVSEWRKKGVKGKFVIPLPEAHVVEE